MTSRGSYFARRLWWPVCAIVALIFLRGCAYSLVNGDRVNSQQAAKIEAGIQDIRQLRFKRPVPLVVKTPDEAESMMEADMMRDYTDDQLKADSVAGALTGLYPAGLTSRLHRSSCSRARSRAFTIRMARRWSWWRAAPISASGTARRSLWFSATSSARCCSRMN